MVRSIVLATFGASLVLGAHAYADVYKYVDEKGQVQYTDKPATLPAERLNVKSQKTDLVALQARQDQSAQANAAAPNATSEKPADARKAAEANAADKAERCIKARERYDLYMRTPRLYEELKDGERRYLTEAEMEAARASAKTSMDTFCQ